MIAFQFVCNALTARVRGLRATTQHYTFGTETPVQTFYHGSKLFDPLSLRSGLKPIRGTPQFGLSARECDISSLFDDGQDLTFSLDERRSFFGDCLRIVNVPRETPLDSAFPAFGWSGTPLLGGWGLTASALAGSITIESVKSDASFADVRLRLGERGLIGCDSILSAPDGYKLPTLRNAVTEVDTPSRGRLELATGRLYDLHVNVRFENSAITQLGSCNPKLEAPQLLFPGLPHTGHAIAYVATEPDIDRFVLTIAALQFVPLGSSVAGDPILMPPSAGLGPHPEEFEAANSSLHPFLYLVAYGPPVKARNRARSASTRSGQPAVLKPLCRRAEGLDEKMDALQNTTVRYVCFPALTDFGDEFALESDRLGGHALAMSPLLGHVLVQFGTVVSGFVPFTLELAAPSVAFHEKFKRLLKLLPPGTKPGLVGIRGYMAFPRARYQQRELSLNTDPYKPSVGVLDIASGVSAPIVLREYLFQSVMKSLLMVEPRTPTDSFAYTCEAAFALTREDRLRFSLHGELFIPYPAGYRFPLPNGATTRIRAGSFLKPFMNIHALEESAFEAGVIRLEFRADTHCRGSFGPGFVFLAGVENGRQTVTLRHEATAFTGQQCFIETATCDDLRIWIANFLVASPQGAKIACYAVITACGDRASLHMISTDEMIDTWLEGRAVV
jgi:hypothetical protein